MIEFILNWLSASYPILVSGVILAGIVWVTARFYYTRFRKVETDLKALPCESHNQLINAIKDDVKSIKDYLVTKDQRATNVFGMKRSPRVLNESGKEVYNIIGGDEFLTANKQLLFDRLANKSPRTALDVELSAKEVCIELLSNPIFDRIKDTVYNAPAIKLKRPDGSIEEYGFTLADVCFVLSIPLRDMYLKEHTDIL